MKHSITALITPAILAGCIGIEDQDWTHSGIQTATASGIPVTLSNERNATVTGAVGTVHFVTGTDTSLGAVAYAGLDPFVDVGANLTTNASFFGDWEVLAIEGITVTSTGYTSGYISGLQTSETGVITLDADFAAGTLTGTSGNLDVAGTFTGSDIDGSVSYKGLSGDLDGMIGANGAAGAFHGNSSTMVYSGGFAVD
ncbi:MAG: hypothetical protein GKR98_02945 [Boseongicola sp.]|nr:MAG: hypothetical protein GKR98_02945 [Boseongicola sp.]